MFILFDNLVAGGGFEPPTFRLTNNGLMVANDPDDRNRTAFRDEERCPIWWDAPTEVDGRRIAAVRGAAWPRSHGAPPPAVTVHLSGDMRMLSRRLVVWGRWHFLLACTAAVEPSTCVVAVVVLAQSTASASTPAPASAPRRSDFASCAWRSFRGRRRPLSCLGRLQG